MMNLIKKWRGNDNQSGFARRGHHGRHGVRDMRDARDTGLARRRDEFDKSFDHFDRATERMWRNPWEALAGLNGVGDWPAWPAVDVAADDKAVTLRVDVPGLGPEDLDVQVSGNLLTIRGTLQEEWSDNRRGVRRQELRSGIFSRTVTLPDYADATNVEARYDKGILTLTVPKVPGKGPRRVAVTAG